MPGQTWEGGFEENKDEWKMNSQKHSFVKRETIDTAYGGGTAIHIHQDPNQSYEGICDKETCEDMPWCSWLSETNQCKFIKRPDFCHLGAIDSIYNQEETLCWVNSHRVMWLSLTYNTAPLKLVVGKKYTYSFYYKGHSAGNLNIKITPSIGWDSLCTNEAWYVANYPSKICPDQPGYYCAYAPVQKKCYQADKALGSVPAGNYSDWTKFTSTFIYTEELSKTVNQNSELINEIGMSMGYNDTGANGTDLFIDNVQLEEGDASSNLTCCGNICKAINQCRVYLPVIDNISPDNGMVLNPATTYVTIRGKNFGQTQGQNKVLFGDKEAGLACQSWSDTEIIVIAPFGISGVVPIKIVTDQGSSIGKNFTINNIVRPSICSLSPNHGKAGDKITISGTNFGDAQINGIYKSQVFFDNKEVVVNSWINGKIEIAVPNGITVSEPKVKVVLKWKDAPNGVDSNEVSFYINPFINNITPDKGPKDSYVTIRGRNFGNTQGQSKILFNNIPAVLAPCKGAWSDDEIIALAPNSETGSVVVKVILPNGQEIFSNNDKIFTYNNDLLAPGICEISPDNGSVDASVKITGSNFGATALVNEGVFFNQVKATVSLNNWTNSQINTNVPQTTSGDVVVTKIGQRDTGKKECVGGISILGVCIGGQNEIIYEAVVLKSNPVWFEVIKTTCGDNKREELEICDGTDLDSKTCANFDSMSGDGLKCKTDCFGFDTTQCKGSPGVCGDGIINSGETCDKTNFGNKKCSDFSSYISGNLLCDNSCQFNYSGCNIYINGSNGNGSNGLQCVPEEAVCGNSCCLANECENRVCKVEPEIVKHWPNCKDVCINAQIDTQFNIDMVSTIFNSSTVELKKCTDNTETCSSLGSQELTSLEITYSNSTKELFINKALNLVQNQWYKVIIKGGENGVKGLNGKILKQDFSWVFKTKNSKCEVDRTKVIPYIHNMYISETYDYLTEAYGSPDSCSSDGQKLAIIDGYKWKSCLGSNVDSCSATCASGGGIGKIENEATESSNIAKITAKARGNTQVCSFYKLLKSSGALTILSKYNCKEGETECVNGCCAQACNASGNCPVLAPYLSSKPDIIAQSPIGYNVCTNKEISATFNQIINKETLNNQNIFLTKNDILVEGDIISRDENNKTTIIFSSKVNLEKNIEYKMTIKKEVKNRDDLTMENDKAWTFKTGATLCQIDHIKIMINGKEKNNDSFTCADDNCVDDQVSITPRNQHNYIAQAQDKNNENILASYVWDKQDANGILSIVDSKNPTQTVTSQRKNGEAIVSVQANAGDIPSKSMEIKVTSLMCENPWKFTDSANVGLDSDTGFEILYCKDR
ncbi:hypothetical protein CVV26_02845 [Candidatus Kuenenbacteria bacterium HGW-Kuenenbacteria-1]|uniref:IPT/TIG domain-containing protein n=1 Tax=Candidatus Kuenenbacteria bacterium HGW-Kuenenbacteria-1 TaxID=2013812 RepID=A0A2N1UMZ2_9BACT|nr:MAG: hypothetical protein CVV26_02845 [Candidatus Kuenenbacteria bacterium HGW-Kuenenbacteria-1]